MSAAAAARVAPAPVPPPPAPPTSSQPATGAHVPIAPAPVSPLPAAVAPVAPVTAGYNPDLDPLGDEIALLCAHITAATYRLLCLLRVYDEEERWQGFRSCAHWLSWRTGISLGPAREKMRVARCLPSLTLIPEAFASGELSYSKVRALTRIADAENEEKLLDFARHGTTAHVERMVRHWRRLDRGDACEAARAERRGLSVWLTDDGSYEVRGRLNPEVGALLLKALEVAEDRLYRAERSAGTEHRTTPLQRRADALGLWLEERVEPQVQLVVHSFKGEERQKEEEQAHEQKQKREEEREQAQEQRREEERSRTGRKSGSGSRRCRPRWSPRRARAFQLKRPRGSHAMPRSCPSRGRTTVPCWMSGDAGGPWAGGCAKPSRPATAGAASRDAIHARAPTPITSRHGPKAERPR